MLLYSCACLNCDYRTATDMPIGIAERAAEMHIMLQGIHKVKIINEQGIQVESYTNEKPQ
jgi:hypothetical protein